MRAASATAPFNQWLGLEVTSASDGAVELHLNWREEFGQYSGLLHVGVMAAALETACGFAGSTVAGNVLASHFAMRFLRPAKSDRFVIRGRVLKPGRRQIFVMSEIFGRDSPDAPALGLGDALLTTA